MVQAFGNEAHESYLFAADSARYRQTKLDADRVMAASSALHYMSLRLVRLSGGSWVWPLFYRAIW